MQSDEHIYAAAAAAAADVELCDLLVDNDDEVAEPGEVTPTLGIIYLATCMVTGLQYVGQTKYPIERRWACHRSKAVCSGPVPKFIQAIREYGADAFNLEILHNKVPIAELNALESREIYERGTLVNGYNSTTGGSGNTTMAPDVIARRAITQRGNPHNSVNKRKEVIDKNLPKYIIRVRKPNVNGYLVANHPLLLSDSRCFAKGGEAALDANLELAKEFLKLVDAGKYTPKMVNWLPVGFTKEKSGWTVMYENELHRFTDERICSTIRWHQAVTRFAELQAADVLSGKLKPDKVIPGFSPQTYWHKTRVERYRETIAKIITAANGRFTNDDRRKVRQANKKLIIYLFDAATLPDQIWPNNGGYYLYVNGEYVGIKPPKKGVDARANAYSVLAGKLGVSVASLQAQYPAIPANLESPNVVPHLVDGCIIGYKFSCDNGDEDIVYYDDVKREDCLAYTYKKYFAYRKMQTWIASGIIDESCLESAICHISG